MRCGGIPRDPGRLTPVPVSGRGGPRPLLVSVEPAHDPRDVHQRPRSPPATRLIRPERGFDLVEQRSDRHDVGRRGRRGVEAGIRDNVEPGAIVYTDALRSYSGLDADYVHETVDHAEKYVEGKIHINGVENFWALLKRGLHGTYVHV